MDAQEFANMVKNAIEEAPQIMEERKQEIKETYEARDEMRYKYENRGNCMMMQNVAMLTGFIAIGYAAYTISNMK